MRRIIAAVVYVPLLLSPSLGQDAAPRGITDPVVLAPFNQSAAQCEAPKDLSRSLVFFQDNDREFMEGVSAGLQAAAADRDLSYSVALAADDANKMIEGVLAAVKDKSGAMVAAPVNATTLADPLRQAIASGAYVGTVVPPPATTILNAPQYLTGERLAQAAAQYITTELDGRANVVLLTHDSLEFLAPRFTAMRDVLSKLPNVTIVADLSPTPVNVEGGYTAMQLILLADPKIDVVLGADTVVLGALKALREAEKARPDQFLGGIDGEPEAIAELRDPNSPYKVSVSLASPVFGYALGYYAADWLDGKSVPQAMDILPTLLDAENIDAYRADLADPSAVFADQARRAQYLRMYGNICFDTKTQFLDFPWSSENR
ncbi:MAG TPA: sugar ABC transporter substrate-binding protein [Devosia sp.]